MKLSLLLIAIVTLSVFSANATDNTNWSAFNVGDRVELDSACTGNWHRVTIESVGSDPYSTKARKFTIKREDGSDWTFSAPGIVAPCMRPLSAAAAQPVQATGSSQPLQGLYLQLQPTGTAYAYIHYYFWKDGRLCQGLPTGGIDREPVDFNALQQHETCGQYRVSGNRMSIQFQGDAKPHDVSLRNFRPDSFEMNGYTTAKVAPFPFGQRVEGTYSATVVGNQMTKQAYVFHPDGSYQFSSKPVTSRDGAPRNYAGTYRFSGNTLQLTGSQGPARLTAYPFPNGGIMIEGSVFAR
jgi:hypothetical protein